MTDSQKRRCRKIIHGYAALTGVGNLPPVPFLGVVVDIVTLTAMTKTLGNVFQQNITKDLAKNFVIVIVKRQIVRRATQAVIKFIPVFGWIACSVLDVFITEATGWELATRLDRRQCRQDENPKENKEDIP